VQSDRQMEIWHYTSELKMHGDRQTIVQKYDTKQLSDQPPVFISTVWFGDLVVRGDKDSKKKGAKHMASKAAWLELGLPPLKA
jgi:dsRNA-specific ribonuclease